MQGNTGPWSRCRETTRGGRAYGIGEPADVRVDWSQAILRTVTSEKLTGQWDLL